jgi:ABC-type multidrug transport system, ATPase component
VITRLRKMDEKRVDEVLQVVGLYNDRKRKAKEYSLGMKQRLGVQWRCYLILLINS